MRVVGGGMLVGLLLAACAPAQSQIGAKGPAPQGAVGAAGGSRPAAAPEPAPEPPAIRAGVAPPPGPYAPGFDAIHYTLELVLPDTGTLIFGRTTARIALVAPRRDTLPLDLTGLAVDTVKGGGAPVGYDYAAGKLRIGVPPGMRVGDTLLVEVQYHGHPKDGLIVGGNVHGDPSAFADDWPNRARFWFPCIDHPSDKATVDMWVGAPRAWAVVANGAQLPADRPLTTGWDARFEAGRSDRTVVHWVTRERIPTYTMVVGAARFARLPLTDGHATPVRPPLVPRLAPGATTEQAAWLFPQDTAAVRSFRRVNEIVAFYSALIAPFPYEKLAHVESATRFGGMENASAIFYDEKALAQGTDIEETVAHETAHQWFGDSVTETDWHHLWLSEGFATYFAALFFQHADGEARFREIMGRSKEGYLHSEDTARAVIDSAQTDLFALLNRNNYDKGAWVLHMLRGLVGDSAFFEGLRAYYHAHAYGNALTPDLQRALETASGRDLGWFFRQWLYEPGFPRIRVAWRWVAGESAAQVSVQQVQSAAWPTFRFPLVLELATAGGPLRRDVMVTAREQTFRVALPAPPTGVTADPDGALLLVVQR